MTVQAGVAEANVGRPLFTRTAQESFPQGARPWKLGDPGGLEGGRAWPVELKTSPELERSDVSVRWR